MTLNKFQDLSKQLLHQKGIDKNKIVNDIRPFVIVNVFKKHSNI